MTAAPSLRQRTISTWVLAFAMGLGLVLCYLLAVPFIPALVGAFTLAVLFTPLDALMRRAVRVNGIAAALTSAMVALIVVVPTILIVGALLSETDRSARLIGTLVDADAWTRAIDARPRLAPILRAISARFDVPELVKAATNWLAGWSGSFVQGSFTSLISLMLMFYFLFYLLRDREEITRACENVSPLTRPEFTKLADRITDTVHATVLGMAAVSVIQGVLGGAMFWWLGLPAPAFWGVLMGLLAVVPFLGAFVIWVPAALVLAVAGDLASAALLTVWGTVVVGLVDNVLYPVLVGRRLMLHTIPSFIAVAGGVIFLGASGLVLGPVIVAVSLTLLEILRHRSGATAPAGDQLSVGPNAT
jgi:predicted PurR-regulated permease PerM